MADSNREGGYFLKYYWDKKGSQNYLRKSLNRLQDQNHHRCLKCKNDTFEKIEANGNCTLLTYTILNAPPSEFRDNSSYALGIVEFSNGIKALGQISTEINLVIGMELKPLNTKFATI
ncbi:MAG TPA: hypothetical protein ENI29_23210 [bacterium]|nr:hypothetical protein [bacterium]